MFFPSPRLGEGERSSGKVRLFGVGIKKDTRESHKAYKTCCFRACNRNSLGFANSPQKSNHLWLLFCGEYESRTRDLLHAMQAL